MISVGDACLNFTADMTNLDGAFRALPGKVKAGTEPAVDAMGDLGDAANDAGKEIDKMPPVPERVPSSMREARGEVALLGEAVGIRLPRHVRTFVAELPGVSSAMSAAFGATAVLYLVKALVDGTDKLSQWIANNFIMTQAMKDSNASIAAGNIELEKLNKKYQEAKERLAELTDGPLAKLAKEENDLTKAFQANADAAERNKTLTILNKDGWEKAKDTVTDYGKAFLSTYFNIGLATSAENDYSAALARQQQETIRIAEERRDLDMQQKAHDEELRQTHIKDALEELENQKKIALASATDEENKYELEQYYAQKKLSLVKEYGQKEKEQVDALAAEIEVAQIEHLNKVQAAYTKMMLTVKQNMQNMMGEISTSNVGGDIGLSAMTKEFVSAEDAAHSLGITLRDDLVQNLEHAKTVLFALVQASKDGVLIDPNAIKQAVKLVDDAQKALDNLGVTADKFKIKWSGMWAELNKEAAQDATAMQRVGQQGAIALEDLTKNIEGAFDQIVLGEKGVGKALEKATASSLASIASQAAVKSIYYLAEGFAALAGFNAGSAANFFTASAEMGAVAGAAGVAGRALSGASGSGSNNNTYQYNNGQSNTGSQAGSGRSNVSVQHFAEGGLITAPTLAMIGEGFSREAVLPLDDADAMATIGKAIATYGGGGETHNHFHIKGMISDDVLRNVMKKMSNKVHRGQASLLSSNTFRVTKRSA
jgi:hypothetical protein